MSEQKPKISVCIVTYNQKEYIGDSIKSVLMQASDEFDLEILVGDDGSTDGAVQVITRLAEQYSDVVRPYIHQKNLGAARNMQFLVGQATGDFIAHLDGDDYWLPGKLTNQIRFLQTHPDCAAVLTNAIVVDTDDNLRGVFSSKIPETFDINYLLEKGNFLNFSSLMYRKTLKETIVNLPAPFIDYRIHINIAKQGNLGWIDKSLVIYRDATATSLIKTSRDNVRQLHWEAIIDAQESGKPNQAALCRSMASFCSVTLFASINKRQSKYFISWFNRCFEAAKTNSRINSNFLFLKSFLTFLISGLFFRVNVRLKKIISNSNNYIYYRR